MSRPRIPVLPSGVYAALLTPRKPGTTDADAAALLDYLDKAIAAGVAGLVLFGATGEFVHFDPAERARTAALAIRRSRVPVLVNISHSTMVGTIALAESAMKIGADGVMLMPPYFYRYNDNDLFAFYQEVAELLDRQIPIYIYNLPAFTNPLTFSLVEKILSLPGVTGIKDSSGDRDLMFHLQELRRRTDFRLMVGNESLYPDARLAGADGIVSGLSAAIPELLVALDRAILAHHEAAQLYGNRLTEYLQWVERLPPVTAIKETAAYRGWIRNEHVLPFSPQSRATILELRSWLSAWLPVTLAECSKVQDSVKSPPVSDSKQRR